MSTDVHLQLVRPRKEIFGDRISALVIWNAAHLQCVDWVTCTLPLFPPPSLFATAILYPPDTACVRFCLNVA